MKQKNDEARTSEVNRALQQDLLSFITPHASTQRDLTESKH
jgi:hypothetical protein